MRTPLVTGGLLALSLVLLPAPGRAQDGAPGSPHAAHGAHHGPAAQMIPGLGDSEIAELREGQGMGQARVAEVQGYPGPRHVLDAWAGGALPLSTEQAARVTEIARAMTAEARRLGERVLDAERELALAFRAGAIDPASLRARVDRIAALRGELRAVHLRAHLETRALLRPDQLARYTELRGGPAGAEPPRQDP